MSATLPNLLLPLLSFILPLHLKLFFIFDIAVNTRSPSQAQNFQFFIITSFPTTAITNIAYFFPSTSSTPHIEESSLFFSLLSQEKLRKNRFIVIVGGGVSWEWMMNRNELERGRMINEKFNVALWHEISVSSSSRLYFFCQLFFILKKDKCRIFEI